MKFLLAIIFLSVVNLANGQSSQTEVGVRVGGVYNFMPNDKENTNPSYLAISSSLFIHFKSKKRISYELEAGYWNRERSTAYYSDWSTAAGVMYFQEDLQDQFIDLTFTAFYSLHKNVPFQEKKTRHYIGLSIGTLLNLGTMNITRTYDSNLVSHEKYGAGDGAVGFVGLSYSVDHSINKQISINGLLSYRMLLGGDNIYLYAIDIKSPTSILSMKIGIGYKF